MEQLQLFATEDISEIDLRVLRVIDLFVSGAIDYVEHNTAQTGYGARDRYRKMLRDPGCVVMVETPHIKPKYLGYDYLER